MNRPDKDQKPTTEKIDFARIVRTADVIPVNIAGEPYLRFQSLKDLAGIETLVANLTPLLVNYLDRRDYEEIDNPGPPPTLTEAEHERMMAKLESVIAKNMKRKDPVSKKKKNKPAKEGSKPAKATKMDAFNEMFQDLLPDDLTFGQLLERAAVAAWYLENKVYETYAESVCKLHGVQCVNPRVEEKIREYEDSDESSQLMFVTKYIYALGDVMRMACNIPATKKDEVFSACGRKIEKFVSTSGNLTISAEEFRTSLDNAMIELNYDERPEIHANKKESNSVIIFDGKNVIDYVNCECCANRGICGAAGAKNFPDSVHKCEALQDVVHAVGKHNIQAKYYIGRNKIAMLYLEPNADIKKIRATMIQPLMKYYKSNTRESV